MPRASKLKLEKEKLKEIQEHFSYLISTLRDSGEIENFLYNFLSEEEKIMLAKRLVFLMMIKRGYPAPAITSALNISYETVRIHSEKLALKNEAFHKTIERLIKRQESSEFWEKMDKMVEPLLLALGAKTDMKARTKLMTPGEDWPGKA